MFNPTRKLGALVAALFLSGGLMLTGLVGCGSKAKKSSKDQLLTPQKQQEMMKKMQQQGRR